MKKIISLFLIIQMTAGTAFAGNWEYDRACVETPKDQKKWSEIEGMCNPAKGFRITRDAEERKEVVFYATAGLNAVLLAIQAFAEPTTIYWLGRVCQASSLAQMAAVLIIDIDAGEEMGKTVGNALISMTSTLPQLFVSFGIDDIKSRVGKEVTNEAIKVASDIEKKKLSKNAMIACGMNAVLFTGMGFLAGYNKNKAKDSFNDLSKSAYDILLRAETTLPFNLTTPRDPNQGLRTPDNSKPSLSEALDCKGLTGEAKTKCLGGTQAELAAISSMGDFLDDASKVFPSKEKFDQAMSQALKDPQNSFDHFARAMNFPSDAMSKVSDLNKKLKKMGEDAFKKYLEGDSKSSTFKKTGSGSDEKSNEPDLAKMMEDMMKGLQPKDPSGETASGSGSLKKEGSRNPAASGSGSDVADEDSLFKRIHRTYQLKHQNLRGQAVNPGPENP